MRIGRASGHINQDPGERHDLANQMPDKVTELKQRLTVYLAAVNAQMPKPSPNYDPSNPTDLTPREGKRKKGRP